MAIPVVVIVDRDAPQTVEEAAQVVADRIMAACQTENGCVSDAALAVFRAVYSKGRRSAVEEMLDSGLVGDEWAILWEGCSANYGFFMAIVRMGMARETLETLPDYWQMAEDGA